MTIVYPDDTKIWGPDVSFYQDDNDTPRGIDFNVMKEQGASFVFIRAGQRNWNDPDFKASWTAAKEAGLPRGAYWFLDARDSGGRQALRLRDQLGDDWGELPPVVDYEHKVKVIKNVGRGRTRSEWAYNTPAQLDDFIEGLRSPVRPIIYTGYYYWLEHGSYDEKYAAYPLWLAQYRVNLPTVPRPWTDWTFWQFTDNGPGKVLGAESEHIDLNYYHGDVLPIWIPSAEPSVPSISIANELDNAPRLGADVDEPEGSRYIQLSDTLAKRMSKQIREECP